MKKTRLEIYDDYPSSAIDAAITEWIKNEKYRRVLHYKLVDGYSYEHVAELEDLSVRGVQYIINKAEAQLFPHLKIIYKP